MTLFSHCAIGHLYYPLGSTKTLGSHGTWKSKGAENFDLYSVQLLDSRLIDSMPRFAIPPPSYVIITHLQLLDGTIDEILKDYGDVVLSSHSYQNLMCYYY